MEIIKVGNDSLKISLCTNEAKELDFEIESNEKEIVSSFLKLLSLAKIRADKGKFIADIFTGKDGGCEIFLTKGEDIEQVYKDKTSQEIHKRIKQNTISYPFEEFEKLVLVSKKLKEQGYTNLSSLYYDEYGQKYYIVLDENTIKEIKFAFIAEYSKGMKGAVNAYIKEHYKC